MPRPTDIDELLAKWDAEVTEAEKNLPSELVIAYANPQVRAKMHEISVAGKWLKAELEKLEVDEATTNKFCFAFGQRCFMAPDVWDLALKTVELYQKNKATVAANAPPPYLTRDLPPEVAKNLFEIYTKVHRDASTQERQVDELRGDQGQVSSSDGRRGEGDPPVPVEGTE